VQGDGALAGQLTGRRASPAPVTVMPSPSPGTIVAGIAVPSVSGANSVSGGVVSIVKRWAAGVGSALPARSRARASKVQLPSASGPRCTLASHGAKAGAAPLDHSRHSRTEPGSSARSAKTAVALRVACGGAATIVVDGATVSIVNSHRDGLGSGVSPSSARTAKV
jgi:hypothetical protein